MNKKIMWVIFILFGVIIVVASILYFKSPSKEESIFLRDLEKVSPLRPGYRLVKDAHLNYPGVDTSILVRYNGTLYAKALNQEIEGDLDFDGMVDLLVESIYIPVTDGETNSIECLDSMVVRASMSDLVLQKDNQVTLLLAISEY